MWKGALKMNLYLQPSLQSNWNAYGQELVHKSSQEVLIYTSFDQS